MKAWLEIYDNVTDVFIWITLVHMGVFGGRGAFFTRRLGTSRYCYLLTTGYIMNTHSSL